MRYPNEWEYDTDADYYEAVEEWLEAREYEADNADEEFELRRERRRGEE